MADVRATAYRNLSIMLSAGLSLLRALQTASRGGGYMDRSFRRLELTCRAGHSLSDAMAAQPRIFPPLDVMLVRAGDTSGNLAETLKLLADWYGLCHRLRQAIKSGLVLPVAILHIAALIGPLPDLFLGNVSRVGYAQQVLTWLLCFYVPAAVAWAIVRLTPTRGALRRILDSCVAMVPLLGEAVRNLALSRFCWAFHMLLRSAVPVARSMDMAIDACGNWPVARMLRGGAASARNGRDVSEGLSRRLGRAFLDVWEVGEETGTLDEAAQRLAVMAGETAERRFRALATWTPRIVYLLILLRIAVQVLHNATTIVKTIVPQF